MRAAPFNASHPGAITNPASREITGLMQKSIQIRGARAHNLQSLDLDLPRDRLIVMTGLSGSGKSSLAFDTIYAEGQRRYVESLSAYARQFLQLMQKPDVDSIDGLSPAISIEQKTTSRNPRSTVGTVTEIYDYMRLLFARAGIPFSPQTGLPIESQSVSQMVDQVMQIEPGARLYLMAPIVRGRKGEYRKEILDLQKRGFQRLKIDGTIYDIADTPKLDKKFKHTIDVVIDRLVAGSSDATRIADSLEAALALTDGIAIVEYADRRAADGTPERLIFSQKFACPVSGFTIEEIEPRLFSFNNPYGACPECDGLGTKLDFERHLVVQDTQKSLRDGVILPWAKTGATSPYYIQTLEAVCAHYKCAMHTPWAELPQKFQDIILFGSGSEAIGFSYHDGVRKFRTKKPFEGVIRNIERRWRETDSQMMRDELSRFQSSHPCPACAGYRLRPEALAVRIAGLHIGQICEFSILEARKWFAGLADRLTRRQGEIAARILREINERLKFLVDVGLGYLTLGRNSGSLSGGESQRIRLASQIGSGLTGVLYVLDEPSIGLHQRDNARLLETLVRLRDLGNTVIVVEHDEDAIRTADHIVDIGPGAGINGGKVVAAGTLKKIEGTKASLTGRYMSGKMSIPMPTQRRPVDPARQIKVTGARGNNLQNIDAAIPLGVFTCITGVSGGGKSSLLIDTLYRIAARHFNGASETPAPYEEVEGLEWLDKVIDIDQSPIGRTPRSNPATYTGAFGPIREWFAGLPEARARGYAPGRFSFNVKGGRCEACQGGGVTKIEMHFLPDIYVTCDQCRGKRYNRETLEVIFKGKSIADILDLTVEEAAQFFAAVPAVRDKMETLARVGLGYIHVGQQATTLSGGEAQRVKLSRELARRATGRTLYILDEPTTGLHFHDVAKLLEVLHQLVAQGNSVVVIEHNLEVIKTADWIIDLGPEGGSGGGRIVGAGTPEVIAGIPASHTGRFLQAILARAGPDAAPGPAPGPASGTVPPSGQKPGPGARRTARKGKGTSAGKDTRTARSARSRRLPAHAAKQG